MLQTRPAKVAVKKPESVSDKMAVNLSDFFKRAEKTKVKVEKIELNF